MHRFIRFVALLMACGGMLALWRYEYARSCAYHLSAIFGMLLADAVKRDGL